jgi:VanZ family protein
MLPYRLPRPVRLALYALACAILLVLCVLPQQDLPDPGTGDRFEHTASWFVLTVTGYALAPNRVWAIPLFALAYGVFIEILQGVTPTGRHSDPLDFAADTLGVGLGVLLFLAVGRLARR